MEKAREERHPGKVETRKPTKDESLLERFQQIFREEKSKEAEELHNALVEVLSQHKAEIQTILYVLEILKFELLREKYAQLFGESSPRLSV